MHTHLTAGVPGESAGVPVGRGSLHLIPGTKSEGQQDSVDPEELLARHKRKEQRQGELRSWQLCPLFLTLYGILEE